MIARIGEDSPACRAWCSVARNFSSSASAVNQGRARMQVTIRSGPIVPRGDPVSGLDQAGAKAKLMADTNLQVARAGQADDIGRLLQVRRERFLDEHVASGLQCIHGLPVVGQMGAENRQCVGGNTTQELAMIVERGDAVPPAVETSSPAWSARASAADRSGSAQPTIATPSMPKSRSRWIRAAVPQPAIPILTADVFMVPLTASPPGAAEFSQTR